MAMLIDGMYRVTNLPKAKSTTPKTQPAKTTCTPVDGSDRKFYAKAAEKIGDRKILQDLDAALNAQSRAAPPTTSSSTASKPHVQP